MNPKGRPRTENSFIHVYSNFENEASEGIRLREAPPGDSNLYAHRSPVLRRTQQPGAKHPLSWHQEPQMLEGICRLVQTILGVEIFDI